MINKIRENIKNTKPLIHCITNPISINQCANVILAVGGRPIMAEHPKEVAKITSTAKALMLNLGNITDVRMESMKISLDSAKKNNIPVLMDAVGVACSDLRRDFAQELLSSGSLKIVKGNYSEIIALYNIQYESSGVDADSLLTVDMISEVAMILAKEHNVVVLASGKVDIITDGKQIAYLHNGISQLASVTGTGCMLGAICTAMLASDNSIYAAISACAILGIAGELAQTKQGSGTFMVNLMDRISTISDEEIDKYIKMEVRR